jgi:hypothetical protein
MKKDANASPSSQFSIFNTPFRQGGTDRPRSGRAFLKKLSADGSSSL